MKFEIQVAEAKYITTIMIITEKQSAGRAKVTQLIETDSLGDKLSWHCTSELEVTTQRFRQFQKNMNDTVKTKRQENRI